MAIFVFKPSSSDNINTTLVVECTAEVNFLLTPSMGLYWEVVTIGIKISRTKYDYEENDFKTRKRKNHEVKQDMNESDEIIKNIDVLLL